MSVESPLASPGIVDVVVDTLVGMGPIEPLFRDPAVSDVFVNGPDEVWVERLGVLEPTDVSFADDAAVLAAVERTIAPLGLRLDRSSPLVSARLPDGSRLHAVVPPVSVGGPIVAIRRFTAVAPSLDTFVDWGSMTDAQRTVLEQAVIDRRNIVVSGGTGTGKTTLLNALAATVPVGERIVTIEGRRRVEFRRARGPARSPPSQRRGPRAGHPGRSGTYRSTAPAGPNYRRGGTRRRGPRHDLGHEHRPRRELVDRPRQRSRGRPLAMIETLALTGVRE